MIQVYSSICNCVANYTYRNNANVFSSDKDKIMLPIVPLSSRRGSLGIFQGEWRASKNNEYLGGLGKRMVRARGSLGRWKEEMHSSPFP